jgi:hypothetical protein
MSIHKKDYEALLAEYTDPIATPQLLKHYRPYLEMVPSMRRPQDSLISLPLPLAKIRRDVNPVHGYAQSKIIQLPCDIAILMCDPEWQVKLSMELCIYIYRPDEDFSDILRRWRRTQVLLSHIYEWVMPRQYQDLFSEGEGNLYPLFVLFEGTPQRIIRGLKGANLPYIVCAPSPELREADEEDSLTSTVDLSA